MVKFQRRLTASSTSKWNGSRLAIYIVIAVLVLFAFLQYLRPKSGQPKNSRPPHGIGVRPEKQEAPREQGAEPENR